MYYIQCVYFATFCHTQIFGHIWGIKTTSISVKTSLEERLDQLWVELWGVFVQVNMLMQPETEIPLS